MKATTAPVPHELRKIHADSTQRRIICWVILLTIVAIVVACLLGGLAVPLPFLKVVPEPVCPISIQTYRGFCAFKAIDQNQYWQSTFVGLNKTNLFMQITGQFHVNRNNNNTEGSLIRFRIQCALRCHSQSTH